MPRIPEIAFARDTPAAQAVAELAAHQLAVIEAELPAALEGSDPERLHDLRVAVRRTRSLQRELKTVFPKPKLRHFRAEFRWLQEITGPTRDLDVYLAEFDDAGLSEVLGERRLAERERMVDALDSPRTHTLLAEWAGLLADLPAKSKPIGKLATHRVKRVHKQMIEMGDAIDDASPHEALHDLRKKGKELRYLLEFFASLFSPKDTKAMVGSLKALQDSLGRFQDREVQAALIRELAPEMNDLIARLEHEQDEARSEFAERYAAFKLSRRAWLDR